MTSFFVRVGIASLPSRVAHCRGGVVLPIALSPDIYLLFRIMFSFLFTYISFSTFISTNSSVSKSIFLVSNVFKSTNSRCFSPVSGSVLLKVPIVGPEAFSAKLLALRATAVGASLTSVTEIVKASVLVLLPVSVAVKEIE